jgi:polar amino acid transport system permease protein
MDYQLQFQSVLNSFDLMLRGAMTTTLLAAITIFSAIILGSLLAILRMGSSIVVRKAIDAYVEIIRNTPFIVQLFFIVFGLPTIGLQLGLVEAAVLALVINLSGYTTEIIRAGLESIPPAQIEAGYSLGLGRWQVYKNIVLMPALERVYPALCSQFILAMLGTSIVSQISVEELTGIASLISARTYRAFETYIVLAGVYICLTFAFRLVLYALGELLFPWRRRIARTAGV